MLSPPCLPFIVRGIAHFDDAGLGDERPTPCEVAGVLVSFIPRAESHLIAAPFAGSVGDDFGAKTLGRHDFFSSSNTGMMPSTAKCRNLLTSAGVISSVSLPFRLFIVTSADIIVRPITTTAVIGCVLGRSRMPEPK